MLPRLGRRAPHVENRWVRQCGNDGTRRDPLTEKPNGRWAKKGNEKNQRSAVKVTAIRLSDKRDMIYTPTLRRSEKKQRSSCVQSSLTQHSDGFLSCYVYEYVAYGHTLVRDPLASRGVKIPTDFFLYTKKPE